MDDTPQTQKDSSSWLLRFLLLCLYIILLATSDTLHPVSWLHSVTTSDETMNAALVIVWQDDGRRYVSSSVLQSQEQNSERASQKWHPCYILVTGYIYFVTRGNNRSILVVWERTERQKHSNVNNVTLLQYSCVCANHISNDRRLHKLREEQLKGGSCMMMVMMLKCSVPHCLSRLSLATTQLRSNPAQMLQCCSAVPHFSIHQTCDIYWRLIIILLH